MNNSAILSQPKTVVIDILPAQATDGAVVINILAPTSELMELQAPSRDIMTPEKVAASLSPLHDKFNEISVSIPYDGEFVNVAVPDDTFGKSREKQGTIAGEIGGEAGTRDLNLAAVNYLLDREASDLLAKERVGRITDEQRKLLNKHREKWQEDPAAEARAKEAGAITDKEAALLKVYRTKWVRDTDGGLGVDGVRVLVAGYACYRDDPSRGMLVVCSSAAPLSPPFYLCQTLFIQPPSKTPL